MSVTEDGGLTAEQSDQQRNSECYICVVREDGLLNADASANLRATGYLAQERQVWLRRKQPQFFVLFLTPLQVGLSADSSVPDSDGTDHTHIHTHTRARARAREESEKETYIGKN